MSGESSSIAPADEGLRGRNARLWRTLIPLLVVSAVVSVVQPLAVVGFWGFVTASVVLSSPRIAKLCVLGLALYTPVETVAFNFVPESLFMAARFAPQGLLFCCLVGVMVRRVGAGKPLWVRNPLDLPLVLFVVVSVLSFLVNRPPFYAAIIAYQPFLRFILIGYYLVLLLEYDARDAKRLTWLLLLVAGLEAAIGIAQSFFSAQLNPLLTPSRGGHGDFVIGGFSQPEAYEGGYQVFATLGRYNLLGVYLVLFLVLSLPFFLAYPRQRYRLGVLYALLLPCIYFTAARGPLLALAAGVMALFVVRKQWVYVLAPVAGLAALLGVGTMLGVGARYVGYEEATALERVFEVFDPLYWSVHSQNGRLYFIMRFPFELMTLGVERVLFGFGPGTLDWRTMEMHGLLPLNVLDVPPDIARSITDVNWAYILGQAGYIALFAVVWMCWRLTQAAYRIRREHPDRFVRCLAEGFIAFLAAYCVAGLTGPVWEWRPTSLYFWIYAGIVVRLGIDHFAGHPRPTSEDPS